MSEFPNFLGQPNDFSFIKLDSCLWRDPIDDFKAADWYLKQSRRMEHRIPEQSKVAEKRDFQLIDFDADFSRDFCSKPVLPKCT